MNMRSLALLTFVLLTADRGVAQGSPPTMPDRTGSFGASQAGAPEDLQKQIPNPVSSLISFPFQNHTDFNIGPFGLRKPTLDDPARGSVFTGGKLESDRGLDRAGLVSVRHQ
jgi:hypothetical protein